MGVDFGPLGNYLFSHAPNVVIAAALVFLAVLALRYRRVGVPGTGRVAAAAVVVAAMNLWWVGVWGVVTFSDNPATVFESLPFVVSQFVTSILNPTAAAVGAWGVVAGWRAWDRRDAKPPHERDPR